MRFSTQVSNSRIEVSISKEQPANYDNKDTIKPKDMTYEIQSLEEVVRNLSYLTTRDLISTTITTSTRFVHDIGGRRNVTTSTLEITIKTMNFDDRPMWILVLTAINGTMLTLGIENYGRFPTD